LIEASQKEIKIRIAELEEAIKKDEKELSGIKKQLRVINEVMESDDLDKNIYIKSLERIGMLELREKSRGQILIKNNILLEGERLKYDSNEKMNAYYNTKDKILGFLKADIETQRNELRQVIDECFIYNNYLLIAANKRLFLFNINEEYPFDEKALENLVNDKVFMANFVRDYDVPIEQSGILDRMNEDFKAFLDIDKDFVMQSIDFDKPLENKESVKDFLWEYEAKKVNNIVANNINLGLNKNRAKFQKIFSNHNINYDLKDIEYFIDFERYFNIAKNLSGKK
jgi:hypothetical protein